MASSSPAPYLPVPDYYETKEPVSPPDAISTSKTNDIPSSSANLSETSDVLDLNSSDSQGDENENEDRVADVLIERHDGYYFGPLLGFVIPDDGAVRNLVNNTKESFESDAGYFIGLSLEKILEQSDGRLNIPTLVLMDRVVALIMK